jgi:murein DD-endopeptidase MepM/ murein hydrolase activator NlpD
MRKTFAALAVLAAALPVASARAESIDFVRPVVAPLSRHFEPPPNPFAAGHRGIDFAVPVGTTVVAAAAGTVAFAGAVGGSISVSIDHAGGLRTTYSFLSGVLVKKNQVVAQGAPIALSGPGAAGERPNLHFGVRRGNDYLDPEPLLVASFRARLDRVIRLSG